MVKIKKGKFERLGRLANAKGEIRAAAMDQRGSLKKSIAKAKNTSPSSVTLEMMEEFKSAVSEVLTPHASAILLDPEFGLPAALKRAEGTGLLLSYEKTGYDNTLPGRVPFLIHTMSVKRLVDCGADAVKILLYYHPSEKKETNDMKQALIERIGAECEHYEIPFFLEFVGYDLKGGDAKDLTYAREKPSVVIQSMEEFSKDLYHVDVLKVEIPVNMEFVEGAEAFKGEKAYTKDEAKKYFNKAEEVARRPFIFLSAGVSNEVFNESLSLAVESGVNFAGVLCGRATWKEGIPVYANGGKAALIEWLKKEGVENISRLNAVLDKGVHPWWDKYGGEKNIQVV